MGHATTWRERLMVIAAAGAGMMLGGVATSHAQIPQLGSSPPEITLDPTSGPVGIGVKVTGRYWQRAGTADPVDGAGPADDGWVEIYWGSTNLRMGSALPNSFGQFSVDVQVPTSAENGKDYTELIVAKHPSSSSSAGAPFRVDSPNDPQPQGQTSNPGTTSGGDSSPSATESGGSRPDPPPPNSQREASARGEAPFPPAEPSPGYYDGRQPVPVEGYRPPSSTSTGGSSTSAPNPPPSGGGNSTSPSAEPASPSSPAEPPSSPDEPTAVAASTDGGDEGTALSGDPASSGRDRPASAIPALLLALVAASGFSFATARGIRRWRMAHASP